MEINDILILLSLTQTEINAITSPDKGILHNSTTNKIQFYNGTSWSTVSIANTDDLPEGVVNLYNKTHTGEVTGSVALVLNSTSISNKTLVTATSGMEVLVNDSGTLKKVNVSELMKDPKIRNPPSMKYIIGSK